MAGYDIWSGEIRLWWSTPKRERPRCGARCRDGSPCEASPVWDKRLDRPVNGRCRMHGGTSPGAPTGNANALTRPLHRRGDRQPAGVGCAPACDARARRAPDLAKAYYNYWLARAAGEERRNKGSEQLAEEANEKVREIRPKLGEATAFAAETRAETWLAQNSLHQFTLISRY